MNNALNLKITKKKNLLICLFIVSIICLLLSFFLGNSFSALLDNDVEVRPNTDLIYYLNISYDGVDKNGVSSSDTIVSEINSGTLFVEDKLPDGLEFTGFVTTDDGSIGAVKRSDGTLCTGKVIDDTNEARTDSGSWNFEHTEYTYHGLHYDAANRLVTFKVTNLQAGCQLTVGIKTKTPTIDDPDTLEKETRRDFYNFATAREKSLTVNSNTVHAFMGNEFANRYNVIYEYDGDVPLGAPAVPSTTAYMAGLKIGVASSVNVEGYEFSGWTSDDASISNGSFIMPNNDVVLKGSFTEIPTNTVKYELKTYIPDGYVIPAEKDYYPGTIVPLDFMDEGHIFGKYRFLGWDTNYAEITEDRNFIMPANDVVIYGEFEEVKYKVIYQFNQGVVPPNSEIYLPETKEYLPGEYVTLESILGDANGYEFLGWLKEDKFKMPESDVIIYGEWKQVLGTFEPVITIEKLSDKPYFRVFDDILFKIKVTNPAAFAINDVIVKENVDNAFFDNGYYYSIESEHIAKIDVIPAYGSVELNAFYKVLTHEEGTLTNTVEIIGATADNNYQLADKDYTASSSFNVQSKIKICNEVSSSYDENVFQFHITGTTNGFDTWVVLEKDQCETVYVNPGTYKIKEVIPQEYSIKSVVGAINTDNANLVVELGNNYEITYTNEFNKRGFLHSFGRVVNKIVYGGK